MKSAAQEPLIVFDTGHELEALYAVGAVAFIPPLRDGLNLVAKEYIAAKESIATGVLFLSEMAGVLEEFGEALAVNPKNIEQVANSVYEV